MRLLLAMGCAVAALVSAPAFADDDMQAAYANTIVVTEPTGMVLRYYFEPDHTFTATMPDGVTLRGRWERDGDQLCYMAPSGQRSCAPFVGGKQIGDTWSQAGTQGQDVTVTLAAGRP